MTIITGNWVARAFLTRFPGVKIIMDPKSRAGFFISFSVQNGLVVVRIALMDRARWMHGTSIELGKSTSTTSRFRIPKPYSPAVMALTLWQRAGKVSETPL